MKKLRQAALLLQQGHLQEAETLYREILAETPDHAIALWGIGRIALAVGHSRAAIPLLYRAARALPDKPDLLLDLGEALDQAGRYLDAGSAYKLATSQAPRDPRCAVALAAHLTVIGKLEEARRELRRALDLDPASAAAWAALARLERFDAKSTELAAMQALLDKPQTPEGDRVLLHYALGNQFHELGRYAPAFEQLQAANALDLAQCDYAVAAMQPFFGKLAETFTADLCAGTASALEMPLTPIFIVGQPRSGSTLLEQMLSCHSNIAAAGEVSYLGGEVAGALQQMLGLPFPDACTQTTAAQREQLSNLYLSRLQSHAPDARFITDKMPANYQSVGWIRMLLPQAKVIHLRRDPMAQCFSIFRSHFRAAEPFFATLPEIGRYHGFYESIMAHWEKVVPGFVHELHFENLVKNPERELRAVLNFCGLEWESQCLDYQSNPRPVATLSNTRVREPLKADAVADWTHYGARLQPLAELLAPYVKQV